MIVVISDEAESDLEHIAAAFMAHTSSFIV
jgi:hypothetical protein